MKNKFFCLICIVINIFVCTACANKNEKKTEDDLKNNKYIIDMPSILKEDEYVICVNKNNLEYSTTNTGIAHICFHILSNEKLNEEVVGVSLNTDTQYELLNSGSTLFDSKFDQYIYLLYNSEFDWKKMSELAASDDLEKQEELALIQEEVDKEYEMINSETCSSFYDNCFVLQLHFDKENTSEVIENMQLTINNKSYDVDLGKIVFKEDNIGLDYGNYELYFSSGGIFEYNIGQNKDGLICCPTLELLSEKNVTIKNFSVSRPDIISVYEVNMTTEIDGKSINQKWSAGTDINLDSDEKLKLDFTIQDKGFIGEQNYSVNFNIIVEYEIDGKTQYASVEFGDCASRYNSQLLYAMYKDKIDLSTYYNEYLAY